MVTRISLSLPEQVVLLGLHDKEGTVGHAANCAMGVSGAILSQLYLHRWIGVDQRDDIPRVSLPNTAPPRGDDPLLEACLQMIFDSQQGDTVEQWVSRIAEIKDLTGRVARGLCKRGVLRCDEGTVLLVFSRTVYPEVNPNPERRLTKRLRRALFNDQDTVDLPTGLLIALAHHTGLLDTTFGKSMLRTRQTRIEQITSGEYIDPDTRGVREAMTIPAAIGGLTASSRS